MHKLRRSTVLYVLIIAIVLRHLSGTLEPGLIRAAQRNKYLAKWTGCMVAQVMRDVSEECDMHDSDGSRDPRSYIMACTGTCCKINNNTSAFSLSVVQSLSQIWEMI